MRKSSTTAPQPSMREVRLRILESMIEKDWPKEDIKDWLHTATYNVTRKKRNVVKKKIESTSSDSIDIPPPPPRDLSQEQIDDIQLGARHD